LVVPVHHPSLCSIPTAICSVPDRCRPNRILLPANSWHTPVVSPRTKTVRWVKKAVGGAAIGGATAGAWGLVRGDAGQRALAGAAAGAAAGTVRGGMQATETSPIFKNFVNRCLRERGYEVIGWQ